MSWHRLRPLERRPRVSVVVPCYRYGHFLPQSVGSALSQGGVDVDVVIVDDASPDDSAAVASSLADRDDRVRVIVNPANRGHIATYNRGLSSVDGEYVVLLSADDMLPPGALARATALMDAFPSVAFTYGWPKNFSTVPVPDPTRTLGWFVWSGDEWLGRVCRRGRSFIMSPEVVMRGALLRELGGYDPRLPHSADMDLWMRAAQHGDVGRVLGPPQAFYRVHDSNMHLTTYSGMLLDLAERRETFRLVLMDTASDGRRSVDLYATARRSLALEALRWARREFATPRPDATVIEGYETFARETWPAVVTSSAWRVHRRTMAVRAQVFRHLSRGASRVTDHVAWLRWRYGGTV